MIVPLEVNTLVFVSAQRKQGMDQNNKWLIKLGIQRSTAVVAIKNGPYDAGRVGDMAQGEA
jgi:hypothetical protein